jgi:hypothetical protein
MLHKNTILKIILGCRISTNVADRLCLIENSQIKVAMTATAKKDIKL